MDLPEMGLTGEAIVTNIQSAPAVRSGNGRVVTATFKHSSGDCLNLALSSDGTAETIGTTSNHPFWSVDRQVYFQAGSQQLDERVQTYSGDTKRVISKLPRPGPEAVYNLEVHGEHVYYVGVNGVLVHNTGGDEYVGGADGLGAVSSNTAFFAEGSHTRIRFKHGRVEGLLPDVRGGNLRSWQTPSKSGSLRSYAGKQEVLGALVDDLNQPKHVRGWMRNELRRIERGDATDIRLQSPGTESRL